MATPRSIAHGRLGFLSSILLLPLMLSLSGCGTIATTFQSESQLQQDLELKASRCNSLPKAYSGINYHACTMNSKRPLTPTAYLYWSFMVVDLPLSFVADTLLLPYTLYQQQTKGHTEL